MASDHPPTIALDHPYLVDFRGRFSVRSAPTTPPKGAADAATSKSMLAEHVARIAHLQRKLHASNQWAVLFVFQAMDAAGKDGTIRAVMSGVDPAGCQVSAFKAPSAEEVDHDFLWRSVRQLPERGRIGIFNRSYYEEVLIARVHPELLEKQQLPWRPKKLATLFENRYASIRDHELHLARNGIAVVKFFLHVSKKEQKKRFLARIEDEDSNWKLDEADIAEREHFAAYMKAYETALRETSRPWAPWYAIPADDKAHTRLEVARIVEGTLKSLKLEWPEFAGEKQKRLAAMRKRLVNEP